MRDHEQVTAALLLAGVAVYLLAVKVICLWMEG